jgi:hypothetical protein
MDKIVQNNKMISVAQKLWLNYVTELDSLMLAMNLAIVSRCCFTNLENMDFGIFFL